MATNKRQAPLRMSEEGLTLIRAVAAKLGLSQAGAVEVMVRDYTGRNGITMQDAPPKRDKGNAGKE